MESTAAYAVQSDGGTLGESGGSKPGRHSSVRGHLMGRDWWSWQRLQRGRKWKRKLSHRTNRSCNLLTILWANIIISCYLFSPIFSECFKYYKKKWCLCACIWLRYKIESLCINGPLKHDNISNWRIRVMCFCFIMPDISVYLFCQPSPTINSKTLQLENKRNIPNHNI